MLHFLGWSTNELYRISSCNCKKNRLNSFTYWYNLRWFDNLIIMVYMTLIDIYWQNYWDFGFYILSTLTYYQHWSVIVQIYVVTLLLATHQCPILQTTFNWPPRLHSATLYSHDHYVTFLERVTPTRNIFREGAHAHKKLMMMPQAGC